MDKKITLIADKIKQGGKNLVFTGAGISTESGIPDYRSQGGIWDKFRPVYFDEFMSDREAREEYWRRWQELYQGIQQAQPNTGHSAIARLDQMGLLAALITQRIRIVAQNTRDAVETFNQLKEKIDALAVELERRSA